jgi:hypothetical protein
VITCRCCSKALPYRNLAVELLRRLIEDEIRSRRRKNLI